MPTPEEFVEQFFLEHATLRVYDPQKAHEYYLRTRKLKGRKKAAELSSNGRLAAKKISTPNHGASRSERAKEQLASLQKRLDRLKEVLDELVKEAKGRSGIKTPEKKTSGDQGKNGTGGGSKSDSKLTPKERREAAKRSADYRKKHPEKSTASAQVKSVEQKIQDTREAIRKIKEDIATAMEAAQKKTATRGR